MVSGSEEPASPAAANAVALGKLFKLRFAACTVDLEVTEELAPNSGGYLPSYEREHGLRAGGPRVTLFCPDVPSRCTSPAWLL